MPRSAQTSAIVSLSPGRSEVRAATPISPGAGLDPGVVPGDWAPRRFVPVRWSRLRLPICLRGICLPRGDLLVCGQVDLGEGGCVALEPGAQFLVDPGHDGPYRGPALVPRISLTEVWRQRGCLF
jgi:hypothetical protein